MRKTLIGVFEKKDFAINGIRELMDENIDLSNVSLAVRSDKKGDKIEIDPIMDKDSDQHAEAMPPKDDRDTADRLLDYNMALGIQTLGAGYPHTTSSIGYVGTPYIGGVVASGPLFTSLSSSKDKKIVDSFVSLGIPKEASEELEQHILKDKYLVVIDLSDEIADKANVIFRNNKALEVKVY